MARRFFGDRPDLNGDDKDKVREVREVRTERPYVIRDDASRGSGWGVFGTILAVLLIAIVLWAAGILDVNFYGEDLGDQEGFGGGADVRIAPPDGQGTPQQDSDGFNLTPENDQTPGTETQMQ